MTFKFLTELQLIKERKKLLEIFYTETEVDKLLKIRHFLTDVGMQFYMGKIFSQLYKYKKIIKKGKIDIYMNKTSNNLDYHLFISFSKDRLNLTDSNSLDYFDRNIDIYKGVITKIYISVAGFTSDAKIKANRLGILLFGPNEILELEKNISIEEFIIKCKKERVYNKYIYDVRFKKLNRVKKNSNSYKSLSITTKKLYNILENKRNGLIEKNQEDIVLLLKEVRNIIARENKIQSYMVFSNKTLNEIIRKKPSTNRELSNIKGIETYLIEKYGNFIIRTVI